MQTAVRSTALVLVPCIWTEAGVRGPRFPLFAFKSATPPARQQQQQLGISRTLAPFCNREHGTIPRGGKRLGPTLAREGRNQGDVAAEGLTERAGPVSDEVEAPAIGWVDAGSGGPERLGPLVRQPHSRHAPRRTPTAWLGGRAGLRESTRHGGRRRRRLLRRSRDHVRRICAGRRAGAAAAAAAGL